MITFTKGNAIKNSAASHFSKSSFFSPSIIKNDRKTSTEGSKAAFVDKNTLYETPIQMKFSLKADRNNLLFAIIENVNVIILFSLNDLS